MGKDVVLLLLQLPVHLCVNKSPHLRTYFLVKETSQKPVFLFPLVHIPSPHCLSTVCFRAPQVFPLSVRYTLLDAIIVCIYLCLVCDGSFTYTHGTLHPQCVASVDACLMLDSPLLILDSHARCSTFNARLLTPDA